MIDVRRARVEDAAAIAEVGVRAWEEGFRGIIPSRIDPRDFWTPERVAERLRGGRRPELRALVAEDAGELRGYAFFGQSRDEEEGPTVGEVRALYVDPGAWGRGVGTALVEAALDELARMGFSEASLWTAAESDRAVSFYESLGFRPDGGERRREEVGSPLELRFRIALAASDRERRDL